MSRGDWLKAGTVLVIAALGYGLARLLRAPCQAGTDGPDPTAYLLRTEARRRRLLAAVERDKNRQFIAQKHT